MKAKSLFVVAFAALATAACGGSGSADTTAVVIPAEPTPGTLNTDLFPRDELKSP